MIKQFLFAAHAAKELNLSQIPERDMNLTADNKYIECVKVRTHGGSYHRINNRRQIYVVGIGIRQAPGRPGAHHSELNQKPVINSIKHHTPVHVIHELESGILEYRGIYHIMGAVRRITQEGWSYSEVVLTQSTRQC